VGRVGDDGFGESLRSQLQAEGIDTRSIQVSAQQPSGTALIAVAADNNQIIVVPGANGEVSNIELEQLAAYFEQAKVLLLQFEIPLEIVQRAAALAHEAGLVVIVDPAPAQGKLTREFCEHISVLTPNQTEAELLTGIEVVDMESAIAAATNLHQQGIETVIIKMGKLGCACVGKVGTFELPAFAVDMVDTVAAGDAFNGGLAAAICDSKTAGSEAAGSKTAKIQAAVRYANAVAALAVTRSGAQDAMPTAAEVKVFLSTV
ncbi:PfkB family carbohydrate kinase, partial [cf. Phormidesmis sp. LEGE 11477]|uniref:PfkB family carbohydrate kinase n=1 Tax=cf. Phormidesmis sp. LEGE 11477 TaxID=1828680 RepID=UPI00187F8DA6